VCSGGTQSNVDPEVMSVRFHGPGFQANTTMFSLLF
jgi:hypothetical protein